MVELTRRGVVQGALATTFAAPLATVAQASAQAPAPVNPADILPYINPQLRPIVIQAQPIVAKMPQLSAATLAQSRTGNAAFTKKPATDVPWSEKRIPGATGQPDATIYIINAKAGQARPGILHTHGGGFVLGRAKDDLFRLQGIAKDLDCAIVTVEYRLAPETRWSGSIEDNYAGLKWLHANTGPLGVDPKKIAVMGESAGGGHAALLAIVARDRGEVPIMFQCLVYPMLDDRTASSRPVPFPIGALLWTPAANIFGWQSFLGVAPGGRSAPPAVPARVASVKGLPPAWIGVGSIDLFVREDIDYAARLLEAGIMTELMVVPGAFHGFDGIPDFFGVDVPIARQFTDAKMAALRRAFEAA